MAAGSSESPVAVYSAMAANGLIAIAKFFAAAFTGSSAMFSEGIHSLVDTGNQGLVLLGIRRSKKPADTKHPFGYGKELYFWSLIVAILIFGLGGGISFYEGISHIRDPHELGDPTASYIVLGFAFVVESFAFITAYRALRKTSAGKNNGFIEALKQSKDPSIFTVLVEDAAALAGIIIAFLGVYLGHLFGTPYLDGVASILIGIILALVAAFLAYESKGLLLGESADPEVVNTIEEIAETDKHVDSVVAPLTMHFGPRQVLLNLEVKFVPNLSTSELAQAVNRLEGKIRERHPHITRIFIEARGLEGR